MSLHSCVRRTSDGASARRPTLILCALIAASIATPTYAALDASRHAPRQREATRSVPAKTVAVGISCNRVERQRHSDTKVAGDPCH